MDLSTDAPAQETMADLQAAPPSEPTDPKPEAETAAGDTGAEQSSAEEGRKKQSVWQTGIRDYLTGG